MLLIRKLSVKKREKDVIIHPNDRYFAWESVVGFLH